MTLLANTGGWIRSWFGGPGIDSAIADADPKTPAQEADPAREYAIVRGNAELAPFDAARLFGDCPPQPAAVLRQFARLPAVQSSLFALISAVLSSDFEWTPRLAGDNVPKEKIEESSRAVEECQRAEAGLRVPMRLIAWEMVRDALVERYSLAETVMRSDPSDPARLTLDAIRPKPQWCYRFRVDGPMNVVGIDVWTGEAWETIEASKFCWMTWNGRGGNPIGESILDGATPYVNMLCQVWPEFFTWVTQFGRPRTVAIEGENAEKEKVLPGGKKIPGVNHLAAQVHATLGGGTVGVPFGTQVKILESARDGKGLIDAIKLLQGELIKLVIIVVQATVEAEHASRADSSTKRSVLGTFVSVLQEWTCATLRRPYFELLKANHGEAYALEYTPYLVLGHIDPETLALLASAFANLMAANYPTEGMLPDMDRMVGLTARRAGDKRVGPVMDRTDAAAPTNQPPNPAPADGGAK